MSEGKKSNEGDRDLTSLDDLSEFVHAEDSLLDDQFKRLAQSPADDSTKKDLVLDLDAEGSLPDLPLESSFEATQTKSDLGHSWENQDLGDEEGEGDQESAEGSEDPFAREWSFSEEALEEASSEPFFAGESPDIPAEVPAQPEEDVPVPEKRPKEVPVRRPEERPVPHLPDDVPAPPPGPAEIPEQPPRSQSSEKFEEVKTFAQNFSYGKASGGGNPPFSIILRQIKYREDAEDILELLKEFGLLAEGDEEITKKAMELGSLIIPQMSEYCALILAHKLRAFDLDMEVGLSDQIRPPSATDDNARGRLQKKSLHQNKALQVKLAEGPKGQRDVIISTGTHLPGFSVCDYRGVETVFSIVEEQDLEKLHFIQKTQREDLPLYEYELGMEALGSDSPPVREAFLNYQKSFLHLYRDLAEKLKDKAVSEGANALLGLNFQLCSIPFKEKDKTKNAYHIICSATLATVAKEEGA